MNVQRGNFAQRKALQTGFQKGEYGKILPQADGRKKGLLLALDKKLPGFLQLFSIERTDKWPPRWPLRFFQQGHTRFFGEPVALPAIATDTGGDHIFPGGSPSPVLGQYMVHI